MIANEETADAIKIVQNKSSPGSKLGEWSSRAKFFPKDADWKQLLGMCYKGQERLMLSE